MANLLDKNDRAVRALIFDNVKAVRADIPIYIRNSSETRDLTNGLVDVDTTTGPESPTGSGCYMVQVMIRAKVPAADQPDQDAAANRQLIADLTEAVHNATHQTDNHQDYQATAGLLTSLGNALAVDASNGTEANEIERAANNADMVDYTCLAVVHDSLSGGKMKEISDSLSFVELLNFRCLVAGVGGLY